MKVGVVIGIPTWAVGFMLALFLTSSPATQTDGQLAVEFDRIQQARERAQPEQRDALSRQLSDAFLRLPDGASRLARLAVGARATLDVGRIELAYRSATPPDGASATGWAALAASDRELVLLVQLQACARLDRLVEFVRIAQRHLQSHGKAVRQSLQSEESRLLPLAANALRTTDRPAGRMVFEWLADLEPTQSYRIANLALCLRQIGDLEAAFAAYERGRNFAPEDLELWNDYGLILRAVGRREEALAAFRRSVAIDLQRADADRGKGPGITNLVHYEVLYPGPIAADPMPVARIALQKRPHATMLRRLTLDLQLDRLCEGRDGGVPVVVGKPPGR